MIAMSYKIAVIDYQMSNLYSIKNALDQLDFKCVITSEASKILSADGAILPGVGSFPEAMKRMTKLRLDETTKAFIASKKPFMGICLGFQLLFEESDEFENTFGLRIFPGKVKTFKKIRKVVRVPHVGWNTIKKHRFFENDATPPLKNTKNGECFYFVHSCYVDLAQSEQLVCTTTEYSAIEFCSSVLRQNVFACQFHPEKSGRAGLRLLKDMFSY